MPPYSMDFRQRVVALHDEGMPTCEIAEMMRCRPACVRRLMQRRRELGTIAPTKPQLPDQRLYDDHDEAKTRRLIQQRPDATLREVAEALGKPAHIATVCRTLQRLELPRKKVHARRGAGPPRCRRGATCLVRSVRQREGQAVGLH